MTPTAKQTRTIYDQVVSVTYEYLGPAADRFIARSIEAHLGKKPDELVVADIPRLHEWSKLSIALLTDDQDVIEEFSKNLMSIAENQRI